MKGYRLLNVGEIIKDDDIWVNPLDMSILGKVVRFVGRPLDGNHCCHCYRPVVDKHKEKYSYIARVGRLSSGRFFVDIIGINGKFAFGSKNYSKRSYAVRQAKSFCSKVKGVKLQIEE